jgi:hypothetical protein
MESLILGHHDLSLHLWFSSDDTPFPPSIRSSGYFDGFMASIRIKDKWIASIFLEEWGPPFLALRGEVG